MSPIDGPTSVSKILKPGSLHFRRIFLHFFDIHFIEEKGISATGDRGRAEMDLAVRFAVMLSSRILVPASSYYESDITRQTLAPFLAGESARLFTLVGSGSSYAEFRIEKLEQYATGSGQHRAYSDDADFDLPWQSRTRSSTSDIGAGWRRVFAERDLARTFSPFLGGQMSEEALEAEWREVPDRLGRRAFIVPYVLPLLPFRISNLVVENRLHNIVNHEYFNSYARDLRAAVFQNLMHLGSGTVPSGAPADDVNYEMLVKACQVEGFLDEIRKARPEALDELARDGRFVTAFRATHTAGPFERPTGSVSSRKKVDLAIITALPKEREAVEAVFGKGKPLQVEGDPHVYKMIDLDIDGRDYSVVVVTSSEMGNARAAVAATNLLRSFDPDLFALVGIAGGCPDPAHPPEHVRLGDVVVSTYVFEYDHVKRLKRGKFELRDHPMRSGVEWIQVVNSLKSEVTGFSTDWQADDAAGQAALKTSRPQADVLHDKNGNKIEHPPDPRRDGGMPVVHSGLIASGDTLLKDPVFRDFLRDKHKARAVEMEAVGFREAGWSHGASTIVVRGVVDYCDDHKSDKWHIISAVSAAAVTKLLFRTLMMARHSGRG
jgi:nucleoside phosphorylase